MSAHPTKPCPECRAAPELDVAGHAPRPGGYRIVLECPACGHRETVDPDADPDDASGGWA